MPDFRLNAKDLRLSTLLRRAEKQATRVLDLKSDGNHFNRGAILDAEEARDNLVQLAAEVSR